MASFVRVARDQRSRDCSRCAGLAVQPQALAGTDALRNVASVGEDPRPRRRTERLDGALPDGRIAKTPRDCISSALTLDPTAADLPFATSTGDGELALSAVRDHETGVVATLARHGRIFAACADETVRDFRPSVAVYSGLCSTSGRKRSGRLESSCCPPRDALPSSNHRSRRRAAGRAVCSIKPEPATLPATYRRVARRSRLRTKAHIASQFGISA